VKRLEVSNKVFQARFETVMKVKDAVQAEGVVVRSDKTGKSTA
jgi:hypothetical protein